MADTTTTNLVLTKPENGGSTNLWGPKLNTDFDILDLAIFSHHCAENSASHSGLDFAYKSGKIMDGVTERDVAADVVTLADDTTNYIEITPSSGAVSANAVGFTVGRIPLFTVLTASGAISTVTDKRAFLASQPGQALDTTATPQFARIGVGATAHATNLATITSTDTTADSKAVDISHSGVVVGTGYGIYVAKTGASTNNVAAYFSASGATNNYAVKAVGISRFGDGGTTNYCQIAADGEITLAGTARVKKHVDLANAALGKGSTAPTQVIIGTYTAWEFDIGDDAVLDLDVPPDWASGTDIVLTVCWYIDEAYATASGEVQWRMAWSACPHDSTEAIDAPTHTGSADSGDVNIPATAKYLTETTVLTISGASLSAGDALGITLSRIALTGGTDPTADPAIVHVEMQYTADKLGEAT
jgi:hypothetical protein